jgi:hypothetical protein
MAAPSVASRTPETGATGLTRYTLAPLFITLFDRGQIADDEERHDPHPACRRHEAKR